MGHVLDGGHLVRDLAPVLPGPVEIGQQVTVGPAQDLGVTSGANADPDHGDLGVFGPPAA